MLNSEHILQIEFTTHYTETNIIHHFTNFSTCCRYSYICRHLSCNAKV